MAWKSKEAKAAYTKEYQRRPEVKERINTQARARFDPEKQRAKWVAYYAKNRETYKAARAARRKRPEEYAREMRRQHGLTKEGYQELESRSEGKCQICGDAPKRGLVVDHCHRSGFVRGLLCHGCNTAIGFFGDDPRRLAGAIRYLRRASADLPGSLLELPPLYESKEVYAWVKRYVKRRQYDQKCRSCGTVFTGYKANTLYCSPKCRNKQNRSTPRVHKLDCIQCGRVFDAFRSDMLYCSAACRVKKCRSKRATREQSIDANVQ